MHFESMSSGSLTQTSMSLPGYRIPALTGGGLCFPRLDATLLNSFGAEALPDRLKTVRQRRTGWDHKTQRIEGLSNSTGSQMILLLCSRVVLIAAAFGSEYQVPC